ncbi:MAG: hypothetical protein Q8J68_14530 [Methanolobus sp.]|uniref:hypothetical protein n=1 Tax=Methanolobus sp. TaxID=1874737 RepID=UPI0027311AC1|nr:hypothetical protein [Methanolobus sp.]MDP2218490.1 hypothetical protein [Methanolobus sp.]
MRIEHETSSYNERRYGRPWIAQVDCTKKAGGEFTFGQWIGDYRNGGEGLLILDGINLGDIYARGQKDFRKPRNSAPTYHILGADGKGIKCSSIVEARKVSAAYAVPLMQEVGEGEGI